MVQREVAERIAAEPGGRDYGVLSIAVQYHAKVELGPIIGPEAFKPPPKVDSALIKLTPVSYTHLDVYKRQLHYNY